jgi:hypothetical protein
MYPTLLIQVPAVEEEEEEKKRDMIMYIVPALHNDIV